MKIVIPQPSSGAVPKVKVVTLNSDVPITNTESEVISISVNVDANTYLLAVFSGVIATDTNVNQFLLSLYSDAEPIGGWSYYNYIGGINVPVGLAGAKYFTDAATPTIKVTARDRWNYGNPIKAGAKLSILLIPASVVPTSNSEGWILPFYLNVIREPEDIPVQHNN